ncbi:hypothetical protein ACERII_00850 [Evansella sp. AB-rgal1]|uniref:hypothetical protein n=1 Tax=Evansella sp. AB-rgal1 TaxID=3242696 RepID=UPI00359ECB5E
MGKKTCWSIIVITIAVNVMMLQWTVEAYLGRDNEFVLLYSGIGIAMAFIAFLTFLQWRKVEYAADSQQQTKERKAEPTSFPIEK